MPIRGRSQLIVSSLVERPNLSLPALELLAAGGTLQWGCSIEEHPTGSFSIEGLSSEQLARFEAAYESFCRKLTIYGIEFEIPSTSYERKFFNSVHDPDLDTYSFSVNFEGILKRKVERKLNLVEVANFPPLPKRPVEDQKAPPVGTPTQPVPTELPPRKKQLSLAALAKAAGVTYDGPEFTVDIFDTPENNERSLDEILREKARSIGGFVRYSQGKAEIRSFKALKRWNFPKVLNIKDGSNTRNRPTYFDKVELTGAFSEREVLKPDDKAEEEPPGQEQRTKFVVLPPVIEETVEEDEECELPPKNSRVLWGLDSCFDFSGPKKVRRTTRTINGSTDKVTTEVWGFVYLAEQIALRDELGDPIRLFSSQPELYWQLIEYTEEQHIYEKLSLTRYRADIRVPVQEGQLFSGVVGPDGKRYLKVEYAEIEKGYEEFCDIRKENDLGVIVEPKAEYLVEIKTTGWKMCRFIKEQTKGWTLDGPENPYYPYYKFFKNPYESRTLYKLKALRPIYGDQIGVPFSVRLKTVMLTNPDTNTQFWTGEDANGRPYTYIRNQYVAVITPQPDFVEPLYVEVESRQVTSFKAIADPEYDPLDPDPALVPLITGEESYYQLSRTILRRPTEQRTLPDGTILPAAELKYREKERNYSAQDAGFINSLESVKFSTKIGRPPEAQARVPRFQQVPIEDERKDDKKRIPETRKPKPPYRTRYFVSSDNIDKCATLEQEELNYPDARTVEEAVVRAEAELTTINIDSIQASKTLSFFYPSLRDGDLCEIEGDRYEGNKIIQSVSWSLKFMGDISNLASTPAAVCEGTELTLGLFKQAQLTLSTEKVQDGVGDIDEIGNPEEGNQTPGEPEVLVELEAAKSFEMGGILNNVASRRDFTL